MLTIKRTINNIITSATTTYFRKTINLFSKHQQLLYLINDNYHDMSISTSVSPLYTTNDETIISNRISSCSSSGSKVMTNGYTIRFVELKDIDQVDECNRNNLPENYNDIFYQNQITKWPDLSIIAENDHNEVMGYALGRIESVPLRPSSYGSSSSSIYQQNTAVSTYYGHVASIAINEKYRGLGLACGLMTKLHQQFMEKYQIDTITLYCRVTNQAAINLYSNKLNYKCVNIFPNYYQDGEDACYMKLTGLLSNRRHAEEDVKK